MQYLLSQKHGTTIEHQQPIAANHNFSDLSSVPQFASIHFQVAKALKLGLESENSSGRGHCRRQAG